MSNFLSKYDEFIITRLTFPLTKRMQHGHAVLIHATITRIKAGTIPLRTIRLLKCWTDQFIVFAEQVAHPTLQSLNGPDWTFKPLVPEHSRFLQKEIKEIVG